MGPAALLALAAGPGILLASTLAWPAARPWCARLTPAAPLPALAAVFLVPEAPPTGLDMLLVGIEVGLNETRRVILLAVALVWLAAGLRQAAAGWPNIRFLLCFLATQAGSLGALVAADAIGYYVFYSLLTIASYGLVAVDLSAKRLWAGRLYLSASLVGEMAAISAFMLLARDVEGGLAFLLVFFGLGAKIGVLPFHATLAPAHAAAPPAGAAVLGGVLTTVAAAGWLQFLPGIAAPELAPVLIGLGFAAAFGGALLGTLQDKPKAVLAYSTVSQMGLLTVGTGVAAATHWAATPAVAFFVFHHALTKAALLLSLPVRPKAAPLAVVAAAVLLSLSLSGAPASSGALAKLWLESQAEAMASERWRGLVHQLLPLTSVATTLLMARFVWLLRRPDPESEPGAAWPGLALAATALAVPLAILPALGGESVELFSLGHLWTTTWPVGLGILLAAAAAAKLRPPPTVPPGDIAVAVAAAIRDLPRPRPRAPRLPSLAGMLERMASALLAGERRFRAFTTFGLAYLLLVIALALAVGFP